MFSRILLSTVALAFGISAYADDTKLKVKEGDKFPSVELKAVQAETVKKDATTLSIDDLKGKTVVVFFYPKAMTPGCTVESCGFRDILADFPKDTVILGASADDAKLQQQFIDKEKLTYPLLCDTELKLIRALGIESPRGKVPQRVTFVVDKEGTIKKIFPQVTPKVHAKEVLDFVKTLN